MTGLGMYLTAVVCSSCMLPEGEAVAEASPIQDQQLHRIKSPIDGLEMLLRRRSPPGGFHRAVLMIHGSSFPSALASGFRLDTRSWLDELADAGFDAWALDFLGYGGSDRYPEMTLPPEDSAPLGRAKDAAAQIRLAIKFIQSKSVGRPVSIVAHSWGTMPASLLASEQPELIERLVLFGPMAVRMGEQSETSPRFPAYKEVTIKAQRNRFLGGVPEGEARVLAERHLAQWCPAYLATDVLSGERNPPSVRVPYGPIADVRGIWSGRDFPYRLEKIEAPTLIVRGEWDSASTDADAQHIFSQLTGASIKRIVTIGRATHLMHLESARNQLYREVEGFLKGRDLPSVPGSQGR